MRLTILMRNDWTRAQRIHYDHDSHRHLDAASCGVYVRKIVDTMGSELGCDADGRGVEFGCGAGRFTLPLLERCGSLEAFDLSAVQLDKLRAERPTTASRTGGAGYTGSTAKS